MRLAEWRKAEGLSQEELAEMLGVTQPTISAVERWPVNSIPGRELMIAIYRVTNGIVTPNDFYNLPDLDTPALPLDDNQPAPLLEQAA